MKKIIVLSGLVAAACSAHAVVLFNNGAVVDGNGLSILDAGANTLGATSSSVNGFALADNFAVGGAGWTVQSLDFYAYQTNSTVFTFTSVAWSIVVGPNIATGAVLASGTTAVTSGGLQGYRVTPTTLTNTTRGIYKISADVPDFNLPSGTYFMTWALAGTGASGPFVPPVLGSLGTGNALQSSAGVFAPLSDTGTLTGYDVPFTINGLPVPEPATYALMLAGVAGVVGIARRRAARN